VLIVCIMVMSAYHVLVVKCNDPALYANRYMEALADADGFYNVPLNAPDGPLDGAGHGAAHGPVLQGEYIFAKLKIKSFYFGEKFFWGL